MPKPKISTEEKKQKVAIVGATGTPIFSGYIDVDYQADWRSLSGRIDIINKMVGSNSTVEQVLKAKRDPILSAQYFLNAASDSDSAIEAKAFIEEALFGRISFTAFLTNALESIKYGFALFVKEYIFEADKVWWSGFKYIEPRTISCWNIGNAPWVDGHPIGITQQLDSTDDTRGIRGGDLTIPWDRLMRFTHRQIGDNFEGVSALRSAYMHWYYSDLFYKIAGIAGDRFGVGTPVFEYKEGTNESQRDKYEELVKNMRSNEQAYAAYEEGNVLKIVMPEGAGLQGFLADMIRHHDKKIYDVNNAGFLNLTNGDGGSNALSKDQSSFFLLALQADANMIVEVIQREIIDLCILNGYQREDCPYLYVSDLGKISLDEFTASMAIVKEKKLVTWTPQDEEKVRAQLKLDPRPADVEPDYDISESDQQPPTFARKKYAELRPTDREKNFIRNISDYENFLESQWHAIDEIVGAYEQKYRDGLEAIYLASETELKDGKQVLAKSATNRGMEKKAIQFVSDVTRAMEAKLLDSPIQRRLFDKTRQMALLNLKDDEQQQLMSQVKIDEGKFRSFLAGYISNVQGVMFNEPRRIEENIVLNYGSGVGLQLAVDQARVIQFNRNVMKLSFISHPRGAYNAILMDENKARQFAFYKIVAPKSKIKSLSPSGMTASWLYTIATAAAINAWVNEETGGKNTSATDGLNLHHGASVYYFPISSADLDEEEAIAKAQREELKAKLEQEASNQ